MGDFAFKLLKWGAEKVWDYAEKKFDEHERRKEYDDMSPRERVLYRRLQREAWTRAKNEADDT